MKIFLFLIFAVVLLIPNFVFAAVCKPACKTNEFCATSTVDSQCVPKFEKGAVCNNSIECLSGYCKSGKCDVLAEDAHPEQKTMDAATKLIDQLPGDLVKLDSPNVFIGQAIKVFLGIIGSIALLVFLYSGIMWMTAGGNEQKVSKAQKSMVWAALGLFVIFVSYTAVGYIIRALTF